ncbi:MAG: cation:dicarboxylase symporter family transporter, partial [Tannerellaceae bacterium]|nr:cation:dicarboxylase symporter family transporter [Tannerellaceae bacterium]
MLQKNDRKGLSSYNIYIFAKKQKQKQEQAISIMKLRRKNLSIPLYMQILAGMAVGIIIGLIALYVNAETLVTHWVTPWGQLFIRLLRLIAIPLIFVTLVKGIAGLKDISKFSKLGIKTLL